MVKKSWLPCQFYYMQLVTLVSGKGLKMINSYMYPSFSGELGSMGLWLVSLDKVSAKVCLIPSENLYLMQ